MRIYTNANIMEAEKLINYRELSRLLTGQPHNIRANKVPTMYQERVNELIALVTSWHRVETKKQDPPQAEEILPAENEPTPETIHPQATQPTTGSVPNELRKGTFEKTKIKRVTTNGQCFRTEVWKDGAFIYEYHVTIEVAENHLRDLINQAMAK